MCFWLFLVYVFSVAFCFIDFQFVSFLVFFVSCVCVFVVVSLCVFSRLRMLLLTSNTFLVGVLVLGCVSACLLLLFGLQFFL